MIDQRDKKDAYVTGGQHYERYHVKARLTKFFDASRFPFSDQGLRIEVEDNAHGAERLRYVADEQESGINRSGVPQALKITKSLAMVKLHTYRSRRGDPRLSSNAAGTHSRFIFAMLISPPGSVVISEDVPGPFRLSSYWPDRFLYQADPCGPPVRAGRGCSLCCRWKQHLRRVHASSGRGDDSPGNGQRDRTGNHLPYPGPVGYLPLYRGHNGSRETEAIFR